MMIFQKISTLRGAELQTGKHCAELTNKFSKDPKVTNTALASGDPNFLTLKSNICAKTNF